MNLKYNMLEIFLNIKKKRKKVYDDTFVYTCTLTSVSQSVIFD